MHGSQYRHYMQRTDVANAPIKDIEADFEGLVYLKMDGLNTIGESKTTYIEDYADADTVRLYVPNTFSAYTNKNTTINLTVIFVGTDSARSTTFKNFTEYIREGVHRYWDDARKRRFSFVVKDEIKVSEEKWHGANPYIEVTFPLTNLNGKTEVVNAINA